MYTEELNIQGEESCLTMGPAQLHWGDKLWKRPAPLDQLKLLEIHQAESEVKISHQHKYLGWHYNRALTSLLSEASDGMTSIPV